MQLIRGDTAEFTITATDKETGEVYDFKPNDEILFTVKKTAKESDFIIQKKGPAIYIAPEDTKDLPYGRYVYDVQLSYIDGDGRKIVDTIVPANTFELMEEVTW